MSLLKSVESSLSLRKSMFGKQEKSKFIIKSIIQKGQNRPIKEEPEIDDENDSSLNVTVEKEKLDKIEAGPMSKDKSKQTFTSSAE